MTAPIIRKKNAFRGRKSYLMTHQASRDIARNLKRLEKRLEQRSSDDDDFWKSACDLQDIIDDVYPYLRAAHARRFIGR